MLNKRLAALSASSTSSDVAGTHTTANTTTVASTISNHLHSNGNHRQDVYNPSPSAPPVPAVAAAIPQSPPQVLSEAPSGVLNQQDVQLLQVK